MTAWLFRRRWSAFDVAVVLFCGYLVTLPLLHVTALRNLCLYGSFLATLVSLARREVRWPRADRAIYFLLAYALISVAALFVSQIDVARSLREVRSELLVQLYVLGFTLLYLANRASPRPLLLALAGSFVLLVLVTLLQLAHTVIFAPERFSPEFHLRELSPGFGLSLQFYLPVLAGTATVLKLPAAWRAFALGTVAIAFALGVWYNTVSAVILAGAYLVYAAARHLRGRLRVSGSSLALLACVGMAATVLVLRDRGYEKVTSQLELVGQGRYVELLNMRGGMWAVGIPCAKDAPWHGYGYGQKKVALVCSDEAYVGPERRRGNFMADYFRAQDYGKVSLHNQYLENWFVSGWVGALLWLAFFAAACLSSWRKRAADGLQQLVVLPALLIFLAGCFFNGLWEGPPYGKAIMVVLALALAKHENPEQGNDARGSG